MLRRWRAWLGGVSVACALAVGAASHARAEPQPGLRDGRFEVLTYNVAGLPEGLSNVHPIANLPLIGARLNQFDLVFVQEDFAYPELLRQRLLLPYRSAAFVRGDVLHFGDGLSLFSRLPLAEVERGPWSACHGVVDSYFDCLTPKGYAFSRVELSPGVSVDAYDVHLDAGASEGDVTARRAQLEQLVEAMRRISADRPLILAGDFNLTQREQPEFRRLLGSLGVVDACEALRCAQRSRLDRVLFRSSERLRLMPRGWRLAPGFRDAQGRPLSDHEPVAVVFRWQLPIPSTAAATR